MVFEPYREIEVNLSHVGMLYTTFSGYILVDLIMVASHLMGDQIPFKTNAIFSTTAAVLFLATGILLAIDKSKYTFYGPQFYLGQLLVVASVFSFVNFVAFVVDAAMTIWKKTDF